MAMKRVYHNGKLVNKRTHHMLQRAEARLGYELTILQGSYNRGVGASAGTHNGGGAVDLSPWDAANKVRVLREVGFAAWYRPAIRDLWPAHIHAVAIGDPELHYTAAAQVRDYYNGRDGLASNGPDNGPRIRPIPVWPIPYPRVSLTRIKNQFKTDKPVSRPAIKAVQRCLNRRLKADLVVDGVAGPKTRAAYKRWENKIGAQANDGVPDRGPVSKLLAGYYRLYPLV